LDEQGLRERHIPNLRMAESSLSIRAHLRTIELSFPNSPVLNERAMMVGTLPLAKRKSVDRPVISEAFLLCRLRLSALRTLFLSRTFGAHFGKMKLKLLPLGLANWKQRS
jgi:hypothetical protein